MKAESIEERVANHLRPPERLEFFDELWERAEADARHRAKRWRATAVALGAVAIAAISAAAVLAARSDSGASAGSSRIIDRTIECATQDNGIVVGANVREPGVRPPQPGQVSVGPAGSDVQSLPMHRYAGASKLLLVTSPNGSNVWIHTGYVFDDTVCKRTARIPLGRAGLPSLGSFSHAGNGTFSLYCPVVAGASFFIRLRVNLRGGSPTSSLLAVRVGRQRRAVSFVDWTPTRFKAFGSNGCLQQ